MFKTLKPFMTTKPALTRGPTPTRHAKSATALSVLAVLMMSFGYGATGLAWGKRGHEIVASVAARLLEEKDHRHYLHSHEFDLGYYANVPDLIWRNLGKDIAARESPQHYIDWNKDFEKAFGSPEKLPLSFSEFKARMGSHFKMASGVSPYRIHGLIERCKGMAHDLTEVTQGPLLVCLGELSHYTGDLSQPLHTTDNHDGQLTGQKGIHSYFETTLVDALDPQVKLEVLARARELYDNHEVREMNGDQAVRWLIAESHGKVKELLSLDKNLDRKDIPVARTKFKSLIVDQLAQGAVVTAYVWKEILKPVHEFQEAKFNNFFDGSPSYVEPGKASESTEKP